MPEESGDQGPQHALLIIEEDVLEDPELYQVTKVDHGQNTPQFEIVRNAHRELRKKASEETGTRHRLVTEWYDDEGLAQELYDAHQSKLEARIDA